MAKLFTNYFQKTVKCWRITNQFWSSLIKFNYFSIYFFVIFLKTLCWFRQIVEFCLKRLWILSKFLLFRACPSFSYRACAWPHICSSYFIIFGYSYSLTVLVSHNLPVPMISHIFLNHYVWIYYRDERFIWVHDGVTNFKSLFFPLIREDRCISKAEKNFLFGE